MKVSTSLHQQMISQKYPYSLYPIYKTCPLAAYTYSDLGRIQPNCMTYALYETFVSPQQDKWYAMNDKEKARLKNMYHVIRCTEHSCHVE